MIRAPQGEATRGESGSAGPVTPARAAGAVRQGARRSLPHPEQIAERLQKAGCKGREGVLVALSVLATTASPMTGDDVDWISSVAERIEDEDVLLDMAGVLFAFNTINRIADARRVRLEYRFIRELKPIRGWLERRLVSVTGLAYDLSFRYQPRESSATLQSRVQALVERLGLPAIPDVFTWLSRSPVVLEGVLEMIETNIMHAKIRPDLLREAVAMGVASHAMPGSNLRRLVEPWLPETAVSDAKSLRTWAAQPAATVGSQLVSACRRYAWQVANAAYTITDEQIQELSALGLSDAERLDLTLAAAVFSALTILEPVSVAVAPVAISAEHPESDSQILDAAQVQAADVEIQLV